MKVPFYVKKIVQNYDLMYNTETFYVHLMGGRKISICFPAELLESMDAYQFECALNDQIRSAVEADSKDINIEKEPNYPPPAFQSIISDPYQPSELYQSPTFNSGYSASAFKLIKGSSASIGATVVNAMEKLLPDIKKIVACPACGDEDTLKFIIIHLNDSHGWTREAQADWVESLDLDLEFKTKGV